MRKPTKSTALRAIQTLIEYIGDDPARKGLRDTPARVLRAWEQDWGAGYKPEPDNLLTFFEPPDELSHLFNNSPMIVVSDIAFCSHCEHHLAPFFGTCAIAYIPSQRGKIGLSKLARIVDYFARRLQVQERLTTQIADFLVEHVSDDVAVLMKARHMCMISRGVKQPEAKTMTSELRGAFYSEEATRAEFYRMAEGR